MRNSQIFARIGLVATAALAVLGSGPALGNPTKAMTWATYNIQFAGTPTQQSTWVAMSNNLFAATGMRPTMIGCNGEAGLPCDAYQGDTDKNQNRRILCFVPGVSVNPAVPAAPMAEPAEWSQIFAHNPASYGAANSDWRFYFGWTGGRFGLTKVYKATDILSKADGDAKCKLANDGLGDPNAVMAEHHISGGGWGAGGLIHPNSQTPDLLRYGNQPANPRFWVAINDQTSNPWDN